MERENTAFHSMLISQDPLEKKLVVKYNEIILDTSNVHKYCQTLQTLWIIESFFRGPARPGAKHR